MSLKSKHKGARAELAAILWLLDNGYDVFRNVSDHGVIDVVAIKGSEHLLIDVKSTATFLTPEQKQLGVVLMVPDPEHGYILVTQPNRRRLTKEERSEKMRQVAAKGVRTRFANVVKLMEAGRAR